jgi:hypothetical protein
MAVYDTTVRGCFARGGARRARPVAPRTPAILIGEHRPRTPAGVRTPRPSRKFSCATPAARPRSNPCADRRARHAARELFPAKEGDKMRHRRGQAEAPIFRHAYQEADSPPQRSCPHSMKCSTPQLPVAKCTYKSRRQTCWSAFCRIANAHETDAAVAMLERYSHIRMAAKRDAVKSLELPKAEPRLVSTPMPKGRQSAANVKPLKTVTCRFWW